MHVKNKKNPKFHNLAVQGVFEEDYNTQMSVSEPDEVEFHFHFISKSI